MEIPLFLVKAVQLHITHAIGTCNGFLATWFPSQTNVLREAIRLLHMDSGWAEFQAQLSYNGPGKGRPTSLWRTNEMNHISWFQRRRGLWLLILGFLVAVGLYTLKLAAFPDEGCYSKVLVASTDSRVPLCRLLWCFRGLQIPTEALSPWCVREWHHPFHKSLPAFVEVLSRQIVFDESTRVGEADFRAMTRVLGSVMDSISSRLKKILWYTPCSVCLTQSLPAPIMHILPNWDEWGPSLIVMVRKLREQFYTMNVDSWCP